MVTQKRIKELFTLDALGRLVRNSTRGKAKVGTFSTAKDKDGYLVVGVDGKNCRAHRLVWLYLHGTLPKKDIDHINGIKDDNRPENLRVLSRSENKQNQQKTRSNKCGFKGVWVHKQNGGYVASIVCNGKKFHIGVYETAEEAAKAYADEASVIHKYNPVSQKA